eukprot:4059259-Prymnesium_polylepis.1
MYLSTPEQVAKPHPEPNPSPPPLCTLLPSHTPSCYPRAGRRHSLQRPRRDGAGGQGLGRALALGLRRGPTARRAAHQPRGTARRGGAQVCVQRVGERTPHERARAAHTRTHSARLRAHNARARAHAQERVCACTSAQRGPVLSARAVWRRAGAQLRLQNAGGKELSADAQEHALSSGCRRERLFGGGSVLSSISMVPNLATRLRNVARLAKSHGCTTRSVTSTCLPLPCRARSAHRRVRVAAAHLRRAT